MSSLAAKEPPFCFIGGTGGDQAEYSSLPRAEHHGQIAAGRRLADQQGAPLTTPQDERRAKDCLVNLVYGDPVPGNMILTIGVDDQFCRYTPAMPL